MPEDGPAPIGRTRVATRHYLKKMILLFMILPSLPRIDFLKFIIAMQRCIWKFVSR
jgi:hypothetical protein